ncbi:MAG: hypothetical protein GY861_10185 [bacterium]|nr:hypothetical protein [bacterium]
MQELKKIDPISAGKIYGIMMVIFGVLIGLIYALYFIIMGAVLSFGADSVTGITMIIIGVAIAVAAPVMYGIIGFLSGIIGAAIYNLVAKKIGGLKVEIS